MEKKSSKCQKTEKKRKSPKKQGRRGEKKGGEEESNKLPPDASARGEISKTFPNFLALTKEEKVAFFEALTAARRNLEKSGNLARERFGTVHDEYLEYFHEEESHPREEEGTTLGGSSPSVAVTRGTSSVFSWDESSQGRDTNGRGTGTPSRCSGVTLDEEPWEDCESVLMSDSEKIVGLFLNERMKEENKEVDSCQTEGHREEEKETGLTPKEEEDQGSWDRKSQDKENIEPEKKRKEGGRVESCSSMGSKTRCTPKFDALDPDEKEIFLNILREAHDNILEKNPEKRNEILPLETILKRYEDEENVKAVYETTVEESRMREEPREREKSLKVKITLTSGDNVRLDKAHEAQTLEKDSQEPLATQGEREEDKTTTCKLPVEQDKGSRISCEEQENKVPCPNKKEKKTKPGKKDEDEKKKRDEEGKKKSLKEAKEKKKHRTEEKQDIKKQRAEEKEKMRKQRAEEKEEIKKRREEEKKKTDVKEKKKQRIEKKKKNQKKKPDGESEEEKKPLDVEEKEEERVPYEDKKNEIGEAYVEHKEEKEYPEQNKDKEVTRVEERDEIHLEKKEEERLVGRDKEEKKEKVCIDKKEEKKVVCGDKEEEKKKVRSGKKEKVCVDKEEEREKICVDNKEKIAKVCLDKKEKKENVCVAKKEEKEKVCVNKKEKVCLDKEEMKKIVCGDNEEKREKVCLDKKEKKENVCLDKKDEKKIVCEDNKEEKKKPCLEERVEKQTLCEEDQKTKIHQTEEEELKNSCEEANEEKKMGEQEGELNKGGEDKRSTPQLLEDKEKIEKSGQPKDPGDEDSCQELNSKTSDHNVSLVNKKMSEEELEEKETGEGTAQKAEKEQKENSAYVSQGEAEKEKEKESAQVSQEEKVKEKEMNSAYVSQEEAEKVKEKEKEGAQINQEEKEEEKMNSAKVNREEKEKEKEKENAQVNQEEKEKEKEMNSPKVNQEEAEKVKEKEKENAQVNQGPAEKESALILDTEWDIAEKGDRVREVARNKREENYRKGKKNVTEVQSVQMVTDKNQVFQRGGEEEASEKNLHQNSDSALEMGSSPSETEEGDDEGEEEDNNSEETKEEEEGILDANSCHVSRGEECEEEPRMNIVEGTSDHAETEIVEIEENDIEETKNENISEVKSFHVVEEEKCEVKDNNSETMARKSKAESEEEKCKGEEKNPEEAEDKEVAEVKSFQVTEEIFRNKRFMEEGPQETESEDFQDSVPQYKTGKVVLVDDNVIEKIRQLIQDLERKAKKEENVLENEYLQLMLGYIEYLSKVLESFLGEEKKRTGQRKQVETAVATAEVHLKFKQKKHPDTEQKTNEPPESVSNQEMIGKIEAMKDFKEKEGKKPKSEEKPPRKEGSLVIADPLDFESSSSEEEEVLMAPMSVRERRVPSTKIRLLQDLLKDRARFEEGSINDLKIVHLPQEDYEPTEKKKVIIELNDEDEDMQGKTKIKFFRTLAKFCRCGKADGEDEDKILENLKGEAVQVDVSRGHERDATSATVNQSTMEVLKAAERKKIIQKHWKTT